MFFGDRKQGCRFYEFIFHGFRCMLIENDLIRTVLVLDKGTDIISFVDKRSDTEFVWTNPLGFSCLDKIKANMDENAFSDNYLGGWFDILPNFGSPCEFSGKSFPSHGEVAYLPFEYSVLRDSEEEIELLFITRLSKYPFELRKALSLKKGSSRLDIKESVTNLGDRSLEYSWAFHPNIGKPFLNEDCVFELPFAEKTIKMPPVGANENGLLGFDNINVGEGSVKNLKTGVGLKFSWDVNTFKSCKLWINSESDVGHHHLGGTYVACILPCSTGAMGLSQAAEKGEALVLKGKATAEAFYSIEVI